MKKLSFVILFFLIGCESSKQTFVEYDFKIEAFEWDSNPYKFVSYIQDSILEIKGTQKAAWEFSYIGDIERMHDSWDRNRQNKGELSQELRDSFALLKQADAEDYILERAKDHQVLIINEAHHMPQHRVFTTRLLEELKKQGYKHLGLETYYGSEKNDSTLQANGYPILTTGYYSKEPQFGNLIRVAHQSNFNLFGYESEGHSNGKEREINQAKNIQKYIAKFPNEKLIIHCGFDHGYEGDLNSSWKKAMAGRLTEYTGIDPLTINQTTFSERSRRDLENPYYQLTNPSKSIVYLDQENESFGEYKNGAWFDISVFHPRSEEYDRPQWMVYGNRNEIKYSFETANIECPCLVLAYKGDENIGSAVPYDIQETKDKEVKLVLDDSEFQIIILNAAGRALKSKIMRRN